MAVCSILAIICIVYGIFVRAAGSGTAFFMVWILGGICLLIVGTLLRKGVLQRLPCIWRIVFGGLLAAGVILFLVVEVMILGSFHEKGEKGLSYLLVLGSQVYADGPSLVLQYRLDTAIGYLKENPETICIVSGGQGYNEPMTEAEGMARYLEQSGRGESLFDFRGRGKNSAGRSVENNAAEYGVFREADSGGCFFGCCHK